jgi:uncharacterized membrane protein YphA (DoxX/SURF4 family)
MALWTVQVLLAAAFGISGFGKATVPLAELGARMTWVNDVPGPLVRFIGTVELLGALGLVLPAATRILPWLTPLAAAGLATDMLLASAFHVSRGEPPVTLVLLALSAFVAWGRFRRAPIRKRP